MDSSPKSFERSISILRSASLFYLFVIIILQNAVFSVNSVDPGQTPRSAASDLDRRCFQMSLLVDARHKWVNPCIT